MIGKKLSGLWSDTLTLISYALPILTLPSVFDILVAFLISIQVDIIGVVVSDDYFDAPGTLDVLNDATLDGYSDDALHFYFFLCLPVVYVLIITWYRLLSTGCNRFLELIQ